MRISEALKKKIMQLEVQVYPIILCIAIISMLVMLPVLWPPSIVLFVVVMVGLASRLDYLEKLEKQEKIIIMINFDEEPEVFNIHNKSTFTVEEMKAFAEEYALRCQKQGDGILTGFWDLCKEKYYDRFQNNKPQNSKKIGQYKTKAQVFKAIEEGKLYVSEHTANHYYLYGILFGVALGILIGAALNANHIINVVL